MYQFARAGALLHGHRRGLVRDVVIGLIIVGVIWFIVWFVHRQSKRNQDT